MNFSLRTDFDVRVGVQVLEKPLKTEQAALATLDKEAEDGIIEASILQLPFHIAEDQPDQLEQGNNETSQGYRTEMITNEAPRTGQNGSS